MEGKDNKHTEKGLADVAKSGRSTTETTQVRETWGHRADGIITLIAYSVGEATVLKFPYLCARNGGGAFLVPYILFTVVCALPLYYLELLIGQYFQRGPVDVLKICPAIKGIGVGSALVSLIYASYSSTYYAWCCYYFLHSFTAVLPWSNCDNTWNTDQCITTRGGFSMSHFNISSTTNLTYVDEWSPLATFNSSNTSSSHTGVIGGASTGAAEEFWRLNVLQLSDGLENPGEMRWTLVGLMAFALVGMFLILFKGIRVSGKIVYVTFFCPIILVTVLFIRGMMLPGAIDGLVYYIKPEFAKLQDPRIWIEACGYAMYSMGTGTGAIITVASHNKFTSSCISNSLIVVFGDALITIYCGFAMFSVLGHLAWVKGVTLDHFQSSGFNIPFMVFPEAVTYLPLPQLWSVILFLTFMTLGIDTTVPSFEVPITLICDRFPQMAKRRWMAVAIVMLPMFLLAFPYLTQGGIYLLILVDWYSFVPPIMVFGIIQTLALAWIYGIGPLNKCSMEMNGRAIPRILQIFIKFITPSLIIVIFGYALYGYRPPKYGNYDYPQWATALGWMITLGIVIPTPVLMVYCVWKAKGDTFLQKVKNAFKPDDYEKENGQNCGKNGETSESLL